MPLFIRLPLYIFSKIGQIGTLGDYIHFKTTVCGNSSPDGYDDTFYPPDMEKVPRKLAIVRANKYMVDSSDFLIAYVWHPASNARNLLEYAQARERKGLIRIENLAASNPHRAF